MQPVVLFMDYGTMCYMMDDMLKEYKEQESIKGYSTKKPYPSYVDLVIFPPKFVQPHFTMLNGSSYPRHHIAQFKSRRGSIT